MFYLISTRKNGISQRNEYRNDEFNGGVDGGGESWIEYMFRLSYTLYQNIISHKYKSEINSETPRLFYPFLVYIFFIFLSISWSIKKKRKHNDIPLHYISVLNTKWKWPVFLFTKKAFKMKMKNILCDKKW